MNDPPNGRMSRVVVFCSLVVGCEQCRQKRRLLRCVELEPVGVGVVGVGSTTSFQLLDVVDPNRTIKEFNTRWSKTAHFVKSTFVIACSQISIFQVIFFGPLNNS
eukprot:TRINITY_DN1610_c0_g2_i1.p2 TRINITY_DN1610_c0_g2~~TRINITY_DN1610_c0_g2_i1.p2  ORF type:complete len:105 (+),score=16.36 TRINITY_DN1610_c0_g2_i1:171-485(+)